MSRIKRYLEERSIEFGFGGEINDAIIAQVQAEWDAKAASTHPDAAEWADAASTLADACEALLNRDSCCGGYRSTPTTRKATDQDWLPMPEMLVEHFCGRRTIGLHSTSPTEHCRWLAFDIDAHDGEDPEANLRTARTIASRLAERGLVGYIFDSDGRGGFHVWAKLHALTPAADAYDLAHDVAEGLGVEHFPKQPALTGKRYGNWIRLPGKHHKRDHWTRVVTNNGPATVGETIDAVLELARS